MIRLWAICRTTFVETIRQPIYGWLIFVTIIALVGTLATPKMTLSEDTDVSDQKLMQNLGLGTLGASGLIIAALCASGAITREIDNGTALTILTKPIDRATFVLGKFFGLAGAVTVAFYLCVLVFLMTVRHNAISSATEPIDWPVVTLGWSALVLSIIVGALGNYLFKWPFFSAQVWCAVVAMTIAMAIISFVGKGWTIVPIGHDIRPDLHDQIVVAISPQLLLAIAHVLMAVWIMTAVAVASSTRLDTVLTLVVCMLFAVIASIHPHVFRYLPRSLISWATGVKSSVASVAVTVAAWVIFGIGWVFPNLGRFYKLDYLIQGQSIPPLEVLKATSYCLLSVTGILALGAALFQTRPVESLATSASMPRLTGLLATLGRALALVWALAAVLMFALHPIFSRQELIFAGALLAMCPVMWIAWGRFLRGQSWAWWVALTVSILGVTREIIALTYPRLLGMTPPRVDEFPVSAWGLCFAAMLIALLLPGTRRHLKSTS